MPIPRITVCWWRSVFRQLTQHSVPFNTYFWPNREIKAMFTLNWITFHGATKSYPGKYEQQQPGAAQVQPVNKPSYAGERNEPRENAWASGEAARGLASPLACLSRVYFSRYFPIGDLACSLAQVVHTHRNIVLTRLVERVRCTKFPVLTRKYLLPSPKW